MEKKVIFASIIQVLEQEAAVLTTAAHTSFADATDEESRAESKYDTRSLETSYLASGQARMAVEAQTALTRFKNLPIQIFGPDAAIALSALVEVKTERDSCYYFLGPSSGGTEVSYEGKTVMVLTPESPVGKALLGKKMGDAFSVSIGRNQEHFTIVRVI